MYAHKITDFTGPDGVVWSQADEPSAGDGDVLVDVVAAGVSFADLLQTRGQYQMKVPVPYVPGMDAAGVVRSAPAGSGLSAGQRVAVFVPYGCWAEVVSAPVSRVLPLPDGMGFEAGAASCLNYLTVLFALVRRGRAVAGETLLVHGAAGGVGIAAIGLGRALGLRTVAVASDEAKRSFALQCGADHAVLADGWLAAVRGLLGERSVDIVLDPVGSSPGNDRMTDSLRSLAPEGRVLVLGFAGGEPSERLSPLELVQLHRSAKLHAASHGALTTSAGPTKEVTADHVIIAVGAKSVQLPGLEFDKKTVITSREAMNLPKQPKRIAIGLITRKGKLSPTTEKFCQCAKDAFSGGR